ncbi:RsbRD N-terminal domain-containing protein [Salegentibacter sp. LM13S]|uniref:RsbRD N-terminal domain-containing protein n=1 Tax=Salegentibacter lacus TaxID=2873599 RepID=UPI001CCEC119|nr:RsbRD N-terminal domain-containing protein [Salegentibacter lacus]MBZ9631414.1 RsbRD N-terminal domain-containing protein [Salegentibacter lacus]
MKFAHFIKNNKDEISNEWVEFAQDNICGINELQPKEVRDHIKQMLDTIVKSMEASQTEA